MAMEFKYEKVAQILATVGVRKDKDVAAEHGIHIETFKKWRAREKKDPYLQERIAYYKNAQIEIYLESIRERFSKEMGESLIGSVEFMKQALTELDPSDPMSAKVITDYLTAGLQLFAFSERMRRQKVIDVQPKQIEED